MARAAGREKRLHLPHQPGPRCRRDRLVWGSETPSAVRRMAPIFRLSRNAYPPLPPDNQLGGAAANVHHQGVVARRQVNPADDAQINQPRFFLPGDNPYI